MIWRDIFQPKNIINNLVAFTTLCRLATNEQINSEIRITNHLDVCNISVLENTEENNNN